MHADEPALVELVGVATCDALKLVGRVIPCVDTHATLRAAVRHIGHRALEGHECGERLHLLGVDGLSIANPTLGGQEVGAVLRAVGGDDLDAPVVAPQGELELHGVRALADDVEQVAIHVGVARGLVEEVEHRVEERQFGRRRRQRTQRRGEQPAARRRPAQDGSSGVHVVMVAAHGCRRWVCGWREMKGRCC